MEHLPIENQYCAFIDILGFQNKLGDFPAAVQYYNRFFATFHALENMHDQMLSSVHDALGSADDAAWTAAEVISYGFSDSIILCSSNWRSLLFRVANVMAAMLDDGFLFRGGIGYGRHYHQTDTRNLHMVSEGLAFAVKTEETLARWPRIMMHPSAMEAITASMKSVYELEHLLIQGEDDWWFVNPFFLQSDIRRIFATMRQQEERYHSEPFADKYQWMLALCDYFMAQESIRRNPRAYYTPTDPHSDNPSKRHRFFYPHQFHFEALGMHRYTLGEDLYRRTFSENSNCILLQAPVVHDDATI